MTLNAKRGVLKQRFKFRSHNYSTQPKEIASSTKVPDLYTIQKYQHKIQIDSFLKSDFFGKCCFIRHQNCCSNNYDTQTKEIASTTKNPPTYTLLENYQHKIQRDSFLKSNFFNKCCFIRHQKCTVEDVR